MLQCKRRLGFSLTELLVVVAIILLLMGLIATIFIRSKMSAKQAVSISNLKQLGLAGALYNEENGEFPKSVFFLTEHKLVSKEICASPADPTNQGLANRAYDESYEPGEDKLGKAPYKLSYAGWHEWRISRFGAELFKDDPNAGWLVDLSSSSRNEQDGTLLFSEGVYHRLLFDTSVISRVHSSQATPDGPARSSIFLFSDVRELPD